MRVWVVLVFFASLLSACSPTDFFLGEDNRPPAKALPAITSIVGEEVAWSTHIGQDHVKIPLALSPDANGSTVYIVTPDGILSVYNIETGDVIFQRKLGKEITAGVRLGGNLVFLGTRNGELLALNTSDGSPVWRANIGSAILARPAVSNDMVIVRSNDGGVFAFQLNDGKRLWQYRITDPILSTRGYAEPVIGGGVVILTTDSGRIIVLDSTSGLPIGEQRIAVGQGHNDIQRLMDMDATPQVNRDILFGSAYQVNTFAIDLKKGEPLWVKSGVSTADNFALSPDGIFLHDDIDHVVALNQSDGSIRWKNSMLEGRGLSAIIAIPGRVGVVDKEGYLHWLDINSGTLIGQRKIGNASVSGMAFIGRGIIIWQLVNGNIIALRPR